MILFFFFANDISTTVAAIQHKQAKLHSWLVSLLLLEFFYLIITQKCARQQISCSQEVKQTNICCNLLHSNVVCRNVVDDDYCR